MINCSVKIITLAGNIPSDFLCFSTEAYNITAFCQPRDSIVLCSLACFLRLLVGGSAVCPLDWFSLMVKTQEKLGVGCSTSEDSLVARTILTPAPPILKS